MLYPFQPATKIQNLEVNCNIFLRICEFCHYFLKKLSNINNVKISSWIYTCNTLFCWIFIEHIRFFFFFFLHRRQLKGTEKKNNNKARKIAAPQNEKKTSKTNPIQNYKCPDLDEKHLRFVHVWDELYIKFFFFFFFFFFYQGKLFICNEISTNKIRDQEECVNLVYS